MIVQLQKKQQHLLMVLPLVREQQLWMMPRAELLLVLVDMNHRTLFIAVILYMTVQMQEL
ncbi:hypothetical protein EOG81_25010 [Salmonella enterica]|nr:hypothetical protein [Salmonella enterica]EBS0228763.1 hypothetical protein [Salmonella enterica subsp. enterica serovar Schwarzengrund]EBW6020564.1 hypothetical protein [Salmonella enterica subsp. enterica serovar Infantis]EBY9401601.1 hypothetical protein [Salmonella enterica subsp. enterica serovar Kisarawe]ECS8660852.1 hypothetical protein [Salmonella enterica subsp. enterica serovar Cotham]ECT6598061.1 hypothetical protein [Salmonella enterica subsp. enterica serovar Ealing]